MTITEARASLPLQTQREVRVRASQLAWQALVPVEVFAPNPSLEAQRISETIAFVQEQLQERARTAQAAQSQAERTGAVSSVTHTLTPLERYAAQTREAVYHGFALLDEQRAALLAERTERRAGAEVADLRAGIEQVPLTIESPSQEWHYDSLREVLAAKFGTNSVSQQASREFDDDPVHELDFER